jgi:methylase of polypeptide subunit release factors
VAFGSLRVEYDDRVLRPREWTTLQSAWAAELLPVLPPGDVLELCCGAGQIGLLAVADTDRNLLLVDANETAAGYARSNAAAAAAALHRPAHSVEVRHGLLEEALKPQERFALVIADPPWVPTSDLAMHPGDPRTAIDGGPDGLDLVRACLDVADRHLVADGVALLQVGGREQVVAVTAYLEQTRRLDLCVDERRLVEQGALMLLRRRKDRG